MMATPSTKEMVTPRLERTKATAAHFRISEMTLWRLRRLEGFPQPIKLGRAVLYDIAAIEKWMREREGV